MSRSDEIRSIFNVDEYGVCPRMRQTLKELHWNMKKSRQYTCVYPFVAHRSARTSSCSHPVLCNHLSFTFEYADQHCQNQVEEIDSPKQHRSLSRASLEAIIFVHVAFDLCSRNRCERRNASLKSTNQIPERRRFLPSESRSVNILREERMSWKRNLIDALTSLLPVSDRIILTREI